MLTFPFQITNEPLSIGIKNLKTRQAIINILLNAFFPKNYSHEY
jgi:hypothetical protein